MGNILSNYTDRLPARRGLNSCYVNSNENTQVAEESHKAGARRTTIVARTLQTEKNEHFFAPKLTFLGLFNNDRYHIARSRESSRDICTM